MRQSRWQTYGLIAAITALTGCAEGPGGGNAVTRFLNDTTGRGAAQIDAPEPSEDEAASPIIRDLRARQSVLVVDSAYGQIAASVLAADARVAEAELRIARLRAEAAQRNWLPTIGPRISLTSLGDMAADLVINQVLFDNGRKKAERDLARADVELAAVGLAEDGNNRVYEALSLYLLAEEGRAASAHFGRALDDMSQFEWVMNERVRGGVSDTSDLNILRQRLADLRARKSASQEQATTALAELTAMSATPLDGVRGLSGLNMAPGGVEPVAVLAAQAQKGRAVAQARITRASHLPGLSAGGSIGDSGDQYGLNIESEQLLGLGTGATLQSLAAVEETESRKIVQAREDAQREVQSQLRQRDALQRQAKEAKTLTVQAKANLDLFQRQYEGGQRQVMDVVGVYETYAHALEKELDLTYGAARAGLEIARIRGVLADGGLM
ncbi:TolC family protein [Puniceibacterium sp. IMCC21224]|uniref:TolC family protein n=1 Tax=Puniceibacterium sp. IMCC21224 TaxID=1618204 RepID=UPI00064DD8D6|nr:TolC family protein [Puniceibacterium sp. IMCC21224]KMK66739.1 outer membrane protein [Puniceibacterium sp. IMCC21224]